MDLAHKSKIAAFIASLTAFLLLPPLFPFLRLFFFAPFLIILYYQKNYISTLWISFVCGLILDLFSTPFFPGMNSLIYTVTTAILYHQRHYFFSDRLSTLPLMTFFFSLVATLLFFILVYGWGGKLNLSLNLIYTDLLAMPALDGIYGFFLFVFPSLIFGKRRRRSKEYFAR